MSLKFFARKPNVLYSRGEVAIGIFLLALLASIFALGLIVLFLAKYGYFKIEENGTIRRIVRCLTLSSGIALALLASSSSGAILQNMFFKNYYHPADSIRDYYIYIAPYAFKFFLDLSAALFVGDLIARKLEYNVVKRNSLRIGLYAAFTSFSTLLYYVSNISFKPSYLLNLIIDTALSPVSVAAMTLQNLHDLLSSPELYIQQMKIFSIIGMSNLFIYEQAVAGIVLIITCISFLWAFVKNSLDKSPTV